MSYTEIEYDKEFFTAPNGTQFKLREWEGNEPGEKPTFVVEEYYNNSGPSLDSSFDKVAAHLASKNETTPDECRFYEFNKEGELLQHEYSNYQTQEGQPLHLEDIPIHDQQNPEHMENVPREQITTFDHNVTPVEGADRIELEQELGSQLQPEYTTFDNLSFSHGNRQELQQEIAENMQQQEVAQQQEQAPAPAPASHDV